MSQAAQTVGPLDTTPVSSRDGFPLLAADHTEIGRLAVMALVVIPLLALSAVASLQAKQTVPAGAGLALALFIPILSVVSVVMKHDKSRRRRAGAEKTDHLTYTQYFQIYDRYPLPNIIQQTWFPILVIFLINLYFARLLVYTPELSADVFGNFLMLGHRYQTADMHADEYLRQSFDVMCFAYLGWYVWTVSVIFSRIITMELVAATYYNALVRLVVALFVALVFNHIQTIYFSGGKTFVAEAVGFGVGLFPDTALVSISGWLRRFLLGADERLEEFPLELIQGISPYRKLRLFEMGLDNCENLASANAVELFLTSNLKLVEVADWIGQAQLVLLVGKEGFLTLQKNGYRTIIDLDRASRSQAMGPFLAGLLNYRPEQLADLADGLRLDPSYCRLKELREHLCAKLPGAAQREPAAMGFG